MPITSYVEFSGCGGLTAGSEAVPEVETIAAANHDPHAIASHQANFPNAEHFQADITKLKITAMPWCDLFTAAPSCPAWTTANGMKRDFDKVNAEPGLFDVTSDMRPEDPKKAGRREEYKRSRLLMREVPRYLRAQATKGRPVPIGFIENVVECRLWAEWDSWIGELHKLGYRTRLIALNSMHAQPVRTLRAPQSRNRLFVGFWHESIGRNPDWDKWLRPEVDCRHCGNTVYGMQVFKEPGVDMGTYGPHGQYTYRCPNSVCRREVFPAVLPALAAIDPALPGTRIGDRITRPLAASTRARILAGMRRHWRQPLLTPVGGTWRGNGAKGAVPLTMPLPARTTRQCDAIAIPPNTFPPLIMRNNTVQGDPGYLSTPAHEPLRTLTTAGHQSLLTYGKLLVPYYSATESAYPATQPLGTLTTRDRYGIADAPADLGQICELSDAELAAMLDDVLLRMLAEHEIGAGMAFAADYKIVAPTKADRVRLYGNAVTPPASEVITSALVECLTGEPLDRKVSAVV